MAALALLDVVALAPCGWPFCRLVRTHDPVFEQLAHAIHEASCAPMWKPPRLDRSIATSRPHSSRPVGSCLLVGVLSPDGPRRPARQRRSRARLGPDQRSHADRWGKTGPWIALERARELARRIPDARLEVLATAGHLGQEDEPDELTQLPGRTPRLKARPGATRTGGRRPPRFKPTSHERGRTPRDGEPGACPSTCVRARQAAGWSGLAATSLRSSARHWPGRSAFHPRGWIGVGMSETTP